jgi:nucleotide-binding universal stress UspA family protein
MYRRILVPLDGSARAEAILPHVVNLALRSAAKVTLIRVVQFSIGFDGTESMTMTGGAELAARVFEEDRIASESYLESVRARLQAKGIDTRARVAYGPVIDAILLAAGEEQADLIAMASHGRTGAGCVFYGCVAIGVLHRIDRPLLIVRSRAAAG